MPSRFQLPPIVKAAERLLVDIENAVRRFPRYHRYQIGADLRTQAMSVYRVASRAWRDRAHQRRWVEQLVWAVDELKQYMQTAKLLHAFTSFRQFEELARQAHGLGAQAGGWRKSFETPNAQSAQGSNAVPQRGKKLSTCAASTGANQ
jgi:hypothetical protein